MRQERTKATQEHLEFLDHLRLTGVTNMFGAGPWLERKFGMERGDAAAVLGEWMDTFSTRNQASD